MSHELTALNLRTIDSNLNFLQQYLGAELYPKIDKIFKLSSMPQDVLGAYREVANLMSELLPEADHVVRDDVAKNARATPPTIGGYLSLYFGVQSPASGTRSQFIGLAYYPDRPNQPWTLYIAGAQDAGNLNYLIAESAATQALNGKSFRSIEEVAALRPLLEPVVRLYQGQIASLKSGSGGVIPVTAYRRQQYINFHFKGKKVESRWDAAAQAAYKYFSDFCKNLSPIEKTTLTEKFASANDGALKEKFTYLIFSGCSSDDAFKAVREELAG